MSFDLKLERGDISLNRDGSLKSVIDNLKLRQDIIKILLTKIGENKYHPRYGSQIGALEIGHVADQEILELDLSASVESAMRTLIALQKAQSQKQYLTPAETIIDILNINVTRDEIDPRLYNIFISIVTGEIKNITESITVRIA